MRKNSLLSVKNLLKYTKIDKNWQEETKKGGVTTQERTSGNLLFGSGAKYGRYLSGGAEYGRFRPGPSLFALAADKSIHIIEKVALNSTCLAICLQESCGSASPSPAPSALYVFWKESLDLTLTRPSYPPDVVITRCCIT